MLVRAAALEGAQAMRVLALLLRLTLFLIAFIVLLSIVGSTYVFFQERELSKTAPGIHDEAVRLASTHDAVIVTASIDSINALIASLEFPFEGNLLTGKLSKFQLIESIGWIQAKVDVELSFSLTSSLMLRGEPTFYPTVAQQGERLVVTIRHIDPGELRVISGDRTLLVVPAAITNIASSAWGLFYRAAELASFSRNYSFAADTAAVMPSKPIPIGGSSVTFGFSGKPIALRAEFGQFKAIASGKRLMLLATKR